MLDFEFAPEESRVYINKFVEESTKENIKDFLAASSIEPTTIFVLVNAVFFKGNWKSKFSKISTRTKSKFYEHGNIPAYVDMMTQTSHFNYGNL